VTAKSDELVAITPSYFWVLTRKNWRSWHDRQVDRNLKFIDNDMRNDPYTHFSQQLHNKLTWLVIFYYFFTKRKQNKTKKIIKYYQPRQLVVGLLWEMSVRIISLMILIMMWLPHLLGPLTLPRLSHFKYFGKSRGILTLHSYFTLNHKKWSNPF
jgi:hypothetical protein